MKKVFFVGIVLGLFLVTLLSGCGGGGGNTKTPTTAVVTTIAGTADQTGSIDGTGADARFSLPDGITISSDGNLYVTDISNQNIRKITPSGVVTTFAGTTGSDGHADGIGTAASFCSPEGITIDSSGNLYVADTQNRTIRKITLGGEVTTIAGTAPLTGHDDGTGSAARFYNPIGIAVDASGNLFVADTYNYTIRKITTVGEVTTIAGTAGSGGTTDAAGSAARFIWPTHVTIDSVGNLYVTDGDAHTIRKITTGGEVTTIAGLAGSSGSTDGTGSAARFNRPMGITIDSNNNLYVTDFSDHTVRKITPAGVVTTIAGVSGQRGTTDGIGTVARFDSPCGIIADAKGNLYIADSSNSIIRKITFQ